MSASAASKAAMATVRSALTPRPLAGCQGSPRRCRLERFAASALDGDEADIVAAARAVLRGDVDLEDREGVGAEVAGEARDQLRPAPGADEVQPADQRRQVAELRGGAGAGGIRVGRVVGAPAAMARRIEDKLSGHVIGPAPRRCGRLLQGGKFQRFRPCNLGRRPQCLRRPTRDGCIEL